MWALDSQLYDIRRVMAATFGSRRRRRRRCLCEARASMEARGVTIFCDVCRRVGGVAAESNILLFSSFHHLLLLLRCDSLSFLSLVDVVWEHLGHDGTTHGYAESVDGGAGGVDSDLDCSDDTAHPAA